MAVYVDQAEWPFRGQLYCHMVADTLWELHDMARRLGLRPEWFQCPPRASRPHYDLAPSKRAQAIRLGAVEVDRRSCSAIARRLLTEWRDQEQEKRSAL
jgi:hypothetical protein